MGGIRGRPGNSQKRVGDDRRGYRDTENEKIRFQQTEGAKPGDASIGRAEVCAFFQSEQINERFDRIGKRSSAKCDLSRMALERKREK